MIQTPCFCPMFILFDMVHKNGDPADKIYEILCSIVVIIQIDYKESL